MKILIDIGHPASIHLFRNFATIIETKGHNVLFVLREKDIAIKLAMAYNLNYITFGKPYRGIVNKIRGGFVFLYKLHKVVKNYKPDLIFNSTTVYPALIGRLNKIEVISFHNTDIDPILKYLKLFKPLFITPSSFIHNLGNRHLRFKGVNEVAFLHDNYFKSSNIKKQLDIKDDEKLIVLRFVSWSASDDIGVAGLSNEEKNILIEKFMRFGKVLISSEEEVAVEHRHLHIESNTFLKFGQMQDLLSNAALFFGESGAMASEAALLGVPAFYYSSKKLGFLQELEDKYKLLYCSSDFNFTLRTAIDLLNNYERTKDTWYQRRKAFFNDSIDLTKLMIWIVETYPRGIEKLLNSKRVISHIPES